jgi:hypothetical protein
MIFTEDPPVVVARILAEIRGHDSDNEEGDSLSRPFYNHRIAENDGQKDYQIDAGHKWGTMQGPGNQLSDHTHAYEEHHNPDDHLV